MAIETMRAMYAARIIDDAAAAEALDVLVGAGIVQAGAAASAIEAVRSIGAGTYVDRRHDQAAEVADIGGVGDGSSDEGLLTYARPMPISASAGAGRRPVSMMADRVGSSR